MISIVDPETLHNVLRPTVYLPFGEQTDRQPSSRRIADAELQKAFTGEQRADTISALVNSEPATVHRR